MTTAAAVVSKAVRFDSGAALRGFGGKMAMWRRIRGMSQEELAQRMDVSTSYVSMLERGLRNPPLLTMVAAARALRVGTPSLVP